MNKIFLNTIGSISLKRSVLVLLLILVLISGFSQTSYFYQNSWRSEYFIDNYRLDLPKQARIIENNGGAFQFAIPVDVNRPIYLGEEDKSQDGHYHYFYSIESSDAKALNFTLQGLTKSGVESVYVNAENHIFGPYYPEKNSFDITPFPNFLSSELTIEVISNKILKKEGLKLYRIGIVYDMELLNSSDCQVDVNCTQGNYWQDVKRSVVRIQFNNGFLCTGTILNNTLNNGKPYLLTANHCIGNQQSAVNAIFGFNYEAPYCDAPAYEYPGVSSNRLVGSTLIATKDDDEGKLDFTLLELDDPIPESFNVHFAGWSASSNVPGRVAGIHHPGGDVKKISIDYDGLIIGSFSSEYDASSFWRIVNWDVGVTEGGSSGSAIFNEKKQVVGDLTGGEASCDFPFNDFYTRFDLAYNKYDDSSQQLKYWLDPAGLNVYSWYGMPQDVRKDSLNVYVYPNPVHGRLQVFSPTLNGIVKIELYDTNGIMVWNEEYVATDQLLFVDLPQNIVGLHYMKVSMENGVLKKKIVIY
jgi:V8-like Glu-specific endopeptidase